MLAILTSKNCDMSRLNHEILNRMPGQSFIALSADSVEDDQAAALPVEFLNRQTPSGMPPHELHLKIGCLILLSRNLDRRSGLCNGTRMLLQRFSSRVLEAEIMIGSHAGTRVLIPRIPLIPSTNLLPGACNFPYNWLLRCQLTRHKDKQ
jgi:ATP-dependent DNA helicase PIF1